MADDLAMEALMAILGVLEGVEGVGNTGVDELAKDRALDRIRKIVYGMVLKEVTSGDLISLEQLKLDLECE